MRPGRIQGWRAALCAIGSLGLTWPAAAEPPLRLNDLQVIGSHNSYRRAMPAPVAVWLETVRPGSRRRLAYAHPPLATQLDLGVRQLELDVFADPEGGRFAAPPAEAIAPAGLDPTALRAPGFKVQHIPGVDYAAHCTAFTDCLRQVRAWSLAHPGHLPVFITIDAKDQPFGYPGATAPLPLTPALLDALDDEIRSVFPDEALITPDDVRGARASLREAVLAGGWPALEDARGQVLFIFDVRKATAELYRAGHPSLSGRAMFSLYDPGEPEAATLIVQDPRGQEAAIQARVKEGFIVRTRSDADTAEARAGDRSRLAAALAGGAQMISTDYYPGAPDPEGLAFRVSLPDGALQRCNLVRRAASCRLPAD